MVQRTHLRGYTVNQPHQNKSNKIWCVCFASIVNLLCFLILVLSRFLLSRFGCIQCDQKHQEDAKN